MSIEVLAVNISEKKGTVKLPQSSITLNENGVEKDAHSGGWHRQVSLLGQESFDKFSKQAGREIAYGEFAENITTRGELLYEMHPLDRLIGENIELEVTQIGKKCHGDNCAIYREVGNCVMPKEGIFARVIRGGELKAGDQLEFRPKIWKALVITLSDRASRGEYADKSGPALKRFIELHYSQTNRNVEITTVIIPDDELTLTEQIKWAKLNDFDLIMTTGGTGIGERDITPDVVTKLVDKTIPGIMEHIRLKYGAEKPNALLSRGIAGVIGKMQIYTLPGSPKAINEYCSEIFKTLDHAFLMLHNIDGH
ncbi:MOSC domain-containing protein [Prolixibacteraceae bacterium JC049]|nr:MOSC domain-containing protein [Prolixibacteraceae bacterium JC049]